MAAAKTVMAGESTEYGPKVSLRELRRLVPSLYKYRKPAFLWGAPGIGKSDTLKEVSQGLGLPFHLVQLNLMDTPDMLGLPGIESGFTKWFPPEFIPTDPALIVLDEMNAASSQVQVCANLMLLDHRWGNVQLHPDTYVIGAGNRASDRAIVQPMPTSTRNRLAHFSVEVNVEEWIGDFGLREGFEAEDLAFIAAYPDLLSKFSTEQHAFPSPRSWASVFRMDPEDRENSSLVSSIVGQGAAAQYDAWRAVVSKLPRPAEILKAPLKTPVPDDTPSQWAVTGICNSYMKSPKNGDPKKMTPLFIEYLERMNKQELLAFFVLQAMKHDPTVFLDPKVQKIGSLIRKYREVEK